MKKTMLMTLVTLTLLPGLLRAEPALVQDLQGKAEILKKGESRWISASKGMQVNAGDRIKTAANATAFLRFENAMAKLFSESECEITEHALSGDGTQTRLFLRAGWMESDVRELSQRDMYEISSPTNVAAVRGTIFNLGVFERLGIPYTRVGVKDGKVIFCTLNRIICITVSEDEAATGNQNQVKKTEDSDDDDYISPDDAFDSQPGFDQEPPAMNSQESSSSDYDNDDGGFGGGV